MPKCVQKILMQNQAELISDLRNIHQIEGESLDAVTAVVWSAWVGSSPKKHEDSQVNHSDQQQSGVILVNGILMGDPNMLHGDELTGVSVNLTWLYSEEFEKKTRERGFLCIDPEKIKQLGILYPTDDRHSIGVQFAKMDGGKFQFKFRGKSWNFQSVDKVFLLLQSRSFFLFSFLYL